MRGPVAGLDPRAFDVDRRRLARRRRSSDLVLYELHVGTFTPEGTFDAAIEHLAELRELGVTAIELMPVAEFPGRRGWGYDGVYLSAAQSSYGGPEGLAAPRRRRPRGGPRRRPRRRLQPPRRVGREGARGLRPLLHRPVRDPWGKAVNYDDADCDPVREWAAAERRGLGPRLPRRRPAPRRDPRDLRRRVARATSLRRAGRPRARGATTARSSSPSPASTTRASSARASDGRLRARRGVGRRLPPRAAGARHRRARGLLRRVRRGRATWPRPSGARFVHDGTYSSFRRRRFGAPAPDRPADAVRRLRPEPRPGRQPRARRPAAARGPAARRLPDAAVALHADAVHGRGVRRGGAVPVLHRPHRRGDRRRDPRGAPPRVRRLRGLRGRGGPRPAGPRDVRALEAHAPRRPRAARALRPPARVRRELRARRRRRDPLRRRPRGPLAASSARGDGGARRELRAPRDRGPPCRRRAPCALATHDGARRTTAPSSCPRSPARW